MYIYIYVATYPCGIQIEELDKKNILEMTLCNPSFAG